MDKNSLASQASDPKRFEAAFREQEAQMEEEMRWLEDRKKRWRTKLVFYFWIFFIGFFSVCFAMVILPREPFPDPQIFARLNPITTPWTVSIFSGGFGFLLKKLRHAQYWTAKNTAAAILGGLFGLIPEVQVYMAEAFYFVLTILIS